MKKRPKTALIQVISLDLMGMIEIDDNEYSEFAE